MPKLKKARVRVRKGKAKIKVRKKKSVMYYSGWGKGKRIKEEKTEKQAKLI